MKKIKNATVNFIDGAQLEIVSRQEKILEEEIENIKISFEDGTRAEIISRKERIFDIILSTGKKAVIIVKNEEGICARIHEGLISRNEEDELKKIEEIFLNSN